MAPELFRVICTRLYPRFDPLASTSRHSFFKNVIEHMQVCRSAAPPDLSSAVQRNTIDYYNVMSAMIFRRDFEHLVATVELLSSNGSPHGRNIDTVIHAVLVAEDRRFMRHSGVDFIALVRAAIKWARGGRLEGASTIEQQLVRTVRGRYELTLGRKCSEIILALRLSRAFPKMELINCYLQVAYFGWRANGIEQAAARLGVDLDACSIEEAAALAAMLKVPMPKVPTVRFAERHSIRADFIIKNWAAIRD